MSLIFNSSVNSLSRMAGLKFDHMNQIQGRTFGPFWGLFLANLLAKFVTAKYDSYLPFQLNYNPRPWLAYNKPLASYNHHSYHSQWYPIKNPYNYESPFYQTYPTLTTAAPYVSIHSPHDYENDYHEEYDYSTNTEDPNYYDRLIPAESNHIQRQVVQEYVQKTTTPSLATPLTASVAMVLQATTPVTPIKSTDQPVTTTVTSQLTTSGEPIAAGSNVKVKRQPTQRHRRRGPSRNKYPQRRRRPTTPPPEYYDSYEDYRDKYPPNRRRRPPFNRQSAESYYDEDDNYYDSFETTTRYYKKQKRRPTRKAIKNQNRNDESFEIESTTQRINPNTEIVIVRQAQSTTASSATSTASPTASPTATPTSTETVITNTTTPTTTTTTTTNGTYGYGPSNGNEYVSFTYGPPVGKYQYSGPSFDWYTHEATRNAIVKRVRDIVNIDRRFK